LAAAARELAHLLLTLTTLKSIETHWHQHNVTLTMNLLTALQDVLSHNP
jgi:hypothetical protein